jgi:hypothetical protein
MAIKTTLYGRQQIVLLFFVLVCCSFLVCVFFGIGKVPSFTYLDTKDDFFASFFFLRANVYEKN